MSHAINKKIGSSLFKLSKLRAIVFVCLFAIIGTVFILVSQADNNFTISLASSGGDTQGSVHWYSGNASILVIDYAQTCSAGSTFLVVPASSLEAGIHTYTIGLDPDIDPWVSIDGAPFTAIRGVKYCASFGANANSTGFSPEIGIDSSPPTIGMSSGNTTTQASSITITGIAADNAYSSPSGLSQSGLKSVTVNGVGATLVNVGPHENFTVTVPLSVGNNSLSAVATDAVGNAATSPAINITRTAPPVTNTPPTQSSSSGTSSGGSTASSSGAKSSSTGSSSSSSPKGTAASGSGNSTTGSNSTGSTGSTTVNTGSNEDSGDAADDTAIADGSSPNVPEGSSAKLSSSDGLVSLVIPSGAFSTDAYCSIDAGSSKDLPSGSANAVGPYSLDCTDSNGNALNNSAKPISVSMTLPAGKSNYAAYVNNGSWQKTPSTNNKKTINFKLVKAESFSAIQSKPSSIGSVILNVLGGIVLLLVLGFVIFLLRRHQQTEKYIDYDNYVNHGQPPAPPRQ